MPYLHSIVKSIGDTMKKILDAVVGCVVLGVMGVVILGVFYVGLGGHL